MKKFKFILLLVVLTLIITSCGSPKKSNVSESNTKDKVDAESNQRITVNDNYDREITFEKSPEKAICIGPGALRLYTYVMKGEKLIAVEDTEKGESLNPYIIANPEIKELQTAGPGGPKNEPDAENLSYLKPEVIFSTYGASKEDLDQLQEKVGVPVVGIGFGRETIFEPETNKSIENIGKIMGKSDRANDVISYMDGVKKDLEKRAGSIDDSPKTYIGCIGFRGAQGILSSRSKFNLFQAVNVKNIVDEITEERNIMLDKEKLLELNPEIIFLDLDGESILQDDYKNNPNFYSTLNAFKENKVYALMPYNKYHTNIDTSLINMYYIGSIIHSENFKDIDIAKKASEVYTSLLGKDVYEEMLSKYPKSFKEYSFNE